MCLLLKGRDLRMNCLESRIAADGVALPGNILKVDSFLNHQIDVKLLREMGREFYGLFKDKQNIINKILTVEASGIAIACYVAEQFDCPLVFAKKGKRKNVGPDVLTAEVFSFTKGETYQVAVSRKYIGPGDHILIIDDFLANGQAVLGLSEICKNAGAVVEGAGIAVTKVFQQGERLLKEAGIDVRSLAAVESMEDGNIVFRSSDA